MRGITLKLAVAAFAFAAACTPTQSSQTSGPATERFPVTSVGNPTWYPNGPYGFGVGNTVPNLSFQGKPGVGSGATDLSLRPIQLSDYQRHGNTKTKVLIITACAAWCVPCQQEQVGLNQLWEHYQQTNPGEVVFLQAMVEDPNFHAAGERTLDRWSQRFGVPYDLVLDPTASTMQTMDPNEQAGFPTHLIIRTRNMRITQRTIGETDLAAAIDHILASPNDPNDPPAAPVGTVYPGPTPFPDCSLAGACAGPAPTFTCPGGVPGTSRCISSGLTCEWVQNACPPPAFTGAPCSDVALCGPPPPPGLTCDELGTQITWSCDALNNGTCAWNGACNSPPPPPPPSDCTGLCGPTPTDIPPCPDGTPSTPICAPDGSFAGCGWVGTCQGPPPPPPVDCSAADACGPTPAPSTCPDGSQATPQCLDVGGKCGWLQSCPKGPPPTQDCTGQCDPAELDTACPPGTVLTFAECQDFSPYGGCEWALVCGSGPVPK